MNTGRVITLALILVVGRALGQAEQPEGTTAEPLSLFTLSLEDLMQTEVAIGTVVGTTLSRAPVSITTITREQIAISPARNVADLLEIYVPGALWLNHLSPKIGLRGLIIDRNYKFLLLVNGVPMNQKGAQGATLEIQNWDLNDIERIEVVRGPGSVTYGPGAIAGVVNIIIRSAETAPGGRVGTVFDPIYRSHGGHASYGYNGEHVQTYTYASIRRTAGYPGARFFVVDPDTGDAGYAADDGNLIRYKADSRDRDQVKIHVDVGFLDDWRLWLRFTRSGSPTDGLEHGRHMTPAAGRMVPPRFGGEEGYAAVLEHSLALNDSLSLNSTLAYTRQHYVDYLIAEPDRAYNEHPFQGIPSGNVVYDFAESRLYFRTLAHLRIKEHTRLALGYAVERDWYRPGDAERMFMNLKTFETPEGERIQALMDDGFESTTHTLTGEAFITLHPRAQVLLSGRADRNDYTGTLYSPRMALVTTLNERNLLKLVWQRSIRMSTAEESHKEHLSGRTGDTEKLDGYELIYSSAPAANTTFNGTLFYNRIEAIGWIGDQSRPLGDLDLAGCELDLHYRTGRLTLGVNHAFIKQLDWTSAPGVNRQGISAADYDFNGLTGTGNDLSNWSSHTSKAFATFRVRPRVTAHADMQVFWRWEGADDYMRMYDRRYAGAPDEEDWLALRRRLRREGYGDTDLRLNLALAWQAPIAHDTRVTLFARNVLGTRRYSYSSGVTRDYPAKISWVEEPAAVGIQAEMVF